MRVIPAQRQLIPWPGERRRTWLSGPLTSPPRLGLGLMAGLVAGLMLLTPLYLALRTAESGPAAVDLLLKTGTLATLRRTAALTVAVTMATTAIALPLAWLTVCTDLRWRRLWAVAAALPLVIPSYVAAYLFVSVFGPRGLLWQGVAPWTGLDRLPSVYGFPGSLAVLTLITYPYTFLSVRAALKRLDPALVEVARSLGQSPWTAFRRVTLPQLRPAIVAGSLLVSLYVLRDFGAVSLLRYNTFTRTIYIQYQSLFSRSLAAALALVLVALTALILYLDLATRSRARYHRVGLGTPRPAVTVALGRWQLPALLFSGSIVGLALVGPAGGLLYWLARGARQQWTVRLAGSAGNMAGLETLWLPAWNSVTASFLAALLTVLAALPVAILAVRRPSRFSLAVERLTYAGYALPGIVVALALVFFGSQYARPLYQTLPLLLVAYVILFIPQAVGTTRASLLQVSASLEEAARSLGHRPLAVFRRVTLPLVRPGVLAGGGLVFLTCMKELPATLIVSPLGFPTLATSVWANISEAFFARAAAPTLLLILLSSVPLAILTWRHND